MLVYDESSWRIAYDTTCAKMRMIKLYVKLHHLQSDWNDDLFAGSQPGSSSIPPQQSYNMNTLSRLNVKSFIGNISNQEEKINFDPIPTDNEDEDDEDYNGSEDEDEDEKDEEDIDDDDDDDDEYIRPVISHVDQYNPFIGRGLVYPASKFHDFSSWVPTDHILYKNISPTEGPLVENRKNTSKSP
jgi:hypothetical protein